MGSVAEIEAVEIDGHVIVAASLDGSLVHLEVAEVGE